MPAVFRAVCAVVIGMVVAFVLLMGVEVLSALVHPLPPDFGDTMEEMCAHVESYPAWVLAVVVPGWAAIAFVSTWITGKLSNPACALVTGLLLVAGTVWNVSMLPYPLWFKIGCLIAIPLAAGAGIYASIPRAPEFAA